MCHRRYGARTRVWRHTHLWCCLKCHVLRITCCWHKLGTSFRDRRGHREAIITECIHGLLRLEGSSLSVRVLWVSLRSQILLGKHGHLLLNCQLPLRLRWVLARGLSCLVLYDRFIELVGQLLHLLKALDRLRQLRLFLLDVSKIILVILGRARHVCCIRIGLWLWLNVYLVATIILFLVVSLVFGLFRKHLLLILDLRLGLHQKVHVGVVTHDLNVIMLLLYCVNFSLDAWIYRQVGVRRHVEHHSRCLSRLELGHLLE